MFLTFLTLAIAMIVAFFGWRKTSMVLFLISLAVSMSWFLHLMTDVIRIQL